MGLQSLFVGEEETDRLVHVDLDYEMTAGINENMPEITFKVMEATPNDEKETVNLHFSITDYYPIDQLRRYCEMVLAHHDRYMRGE